MLLGWKIARNTGNTRCSTREEKNSGQNRTDMHHGPEAEVRSEKVKCQRSEVEPVVSHPVMPFRPYCTNHTVRACTQPESVYCLKPYAPTTYINSQQHAPRTKNAGAVQQARKTVAKPRQTATWPHVSGWACANRTSADLASTMKLTLTRERRPTGTPVLPVRPYECPHPSPLPGGEGTC